MTEEGIIELVREAEDSGDFTKKDKFIQEMRKLKSTKGCEVEEFIQKVIKTIECNNRVDIEKLIIDEKANEEGNIVLWKNFKRKVQKYKNKDTQKFLIGCYKMYKMLLPKDNNISYIPDLVNILWIIEKDIWILWNETYEYPDKNGYSGRLYSTRYTSWDKRLEILNISKKHFELLCYILNCHGLIYDITLSLLTDKGCYILDNLCGDDESDRDELYKKFPALKENLCGTYLIDKE